MSDTRAWWWISYILSEANKFPDFEFQVIPAGASLDFGFFYERIWIAADFPADLGTNSDLLTGYKYLVSGKCVQKFFDPNNKRKSEPEPA